MSFLVQPAVQSYVDTVIGNVGASGAFAPGNSNAIGVTSGNHILSRFDFATGTFLDSSEIDTGLGIELQFPSTIIFGGDGKLWAFNDTVGVGHADAYCHIDQTGGLPYVLVDQWGNHVVPTGTPDLSNFCYLTMGTTHWLVCGTFGGTAVDVVRADPPAYPGGNFGFWGHEFTTPDNTTDVCAGPQSMASATAYWTSKHTGGGGNWAFGKTVISSGADSYDPSTWPTPNPDITSTTIKSYAPTDFDAAWTSITFLSGPVWDQTDDNAIVQVEGLGGGNPSYIAKLSAADGSVLWSVAAGGDGFGNESPTMSRCATGTYLYWEKTSTWGGTCHAIDTATGADSTALFAGVQISGQVSDDVLGCVLGNVAWNTADGSLTLLNSTASSGNTMGVVYFVTPAPLSAGQSYFEEWG